MVIPSLFDTTNLSHLRNYVNMKKIIMWNSYATMLWFEYELTWGWHTCRFGTPERL